MVLQKMRAIAEGYLGEAVKHAVVTVPPPIMQRITASASGRSSDVSPILTETGAKAQIPSLARPMQTIRAVGDAYRSSSVYVVDGDKPLPVR